MLTDQPTQLSLAQLFDALPDGVVLLRPVHDPSGQQIIDFIVDYANPAARQYIQSRYPVAIGTSVRHNSPHDSRTTELIFTQLKALVQTGRPSEVEYYNHAMNEWLLVNHAKAGDGVLSITRIMTDGKRAAQSSESVTGADKRQADFLNNVLDASTNGIVAERAIRDADGIIVDFLILSANRQAAEIVNSTVEALVGRGDFELHPELRSSGLFDAYVRTVETGESQFVETYYNDGRLNHWINVSTRKLGEDELVITFSNVSDVKRSQQALERSVTINEAQADLYDGVLAASLNGIITYQAVRDGSTGTILDFRSVTINPVAQQVLHLPDTVPGWLLIDRFPAVRDYGLFDRYVRTVETGESMRFETPYESDGITGWYDVAVVKLGDGFVITFNDITAARRSQQAIEEARADLQAVIDTSQTGICVFSPVYNRSEGDAGPAPADRPVRAGRTEPGSLVDFRFKTVNRMVAALVGQTPDVITGALVSDWFISYRETAVFDHYKRTYETGEDQRFAVHYDVDGFDIWFDVQSVKFGDDVLVTFANYTDLKRAQIALEKTSAESQRQTGLLNSVLNGSINGIMSFEAVRDETGVIIDFRILTLNEAAARMTVLTAEEVVGNRMMTLFPGNVETGLFDLYVHTTETGEPGRTETYYNYDGLDFWLDISAQKFGDGFVVTFTDVSMVKRTQQTVKRQADLLNSILNGSINGIMAFESVRDQTDGPRNGTIVDFVFLASNEASNRMVGKSADELIGKPLLSIFPGNVETGLFDLYVHTTETGEPGRTETYYNYDGLDFWLDISAQKLGDGFVVTFTDVSILKRATNLVEQSVHRLQTVIDLSQTAIFLLAPLYDENGTITDFCYRALNQTLANYVKQTPADMIGTPVSRWFPTYKKRGFNFQRYCEVFDTGQSQRFEIHYDGDGVEAWLDVSAARVGDEILVTFLDFSSLKQLQQQLETSTAELQTVIDTSQTGIFLFSPVRSRSEGDAGPAPADRPVRAGRTEPGEIVDFRFRLANRQLASYVGQEPGAVIGALGSEWFPDYKTNGLFEKYRKTYLTSESQRFDIHYNGSGIDVWLDIMATKMGDEVLVTFGDYTPLKKLQQQLESSVVDLQRSNANLEQFAYVASHDLQEPLRKIQAFGDIIETQYGPVIGDEGADMIRRMQAAAARMQVLIKDVLAYSRIATRRDTVKPVDLRQLVAEVVEDLETAIADRAAAVVLDPLPTVTGDPGQLRQLFQNLLSNSLKFMKPRPVPDATPAVAHEQARIRVTTQVVRGRDAGITVPPGDADRLFHLIEIADNGIGFEPHQAERIFQVFQRLHSRSEYQGTGIGLAIVKKVVENHHGHIQAVGRPGDGATFRILLPA